MRQVVESEHMRIVKIGPGKTVTVCKGDTTYEGPNAKALSSLDDLLKLFPHCRRLGPLTYLFWR